MRQVPLLVLGRISIVSSCAPLVNEILLRITALLAAVILLIVKRKQAEAVI